MSRLYYKLLVFSVVFAAVILTVVICIILSNHSVGTADNIGAAVSYHEYPPR
jgi:hypothetical protein